MPQKFINFIYYCLNPTLKASFFYSIAQFLCNKMYRNAANDSCRVSCTFSVTINFCEFAIRMFNDALRARVEIRISALISDNEIKREKHIKQWQSDAAPSFYGAAVSSRKNTSSFSCLLEHERTRKVTRLPSFGRQTFGATLEQKWSALKNFNCHFRSQFRKNLRTFLPLSEIVRTLISFYLRLKIVVPSRVSSVNV